MERIFQDFKRSRLIRAGSLRKEGVLRARTVRMMNYKELQSNFSDFGEGNTGGLRVRPTGEEQPVSQK